MDSNSVPPPGDIVVHCGHVTPATVHHSSIFFLGQSRAFHIGGGRMISARYLAVCPSCLDRAMGDHLQVTVVGHLTTPRT